MDVFENAASSVSSDEIQQSIYGKMTPAQKWREVLRMREMALTMKRAFLREQNPTWSEQQIQTTLRKIFLYAST
jgi:hypothetical protein